MTCKICISCPLAGLAAAALLAVPMFGQAGIVDDWTTHHVIFSAPPVAAPRGLEQKREANSSGVANDPRYKMQLLKRNARPPYTGIQETSPATPQDPPEEQAPLVVSRKSAVRPAAGTVPASGNACSGTYTGTFSGNLTVSAGQNCNFTSGGVTGSIQQNGGILTLSNSQVGSGVEISGGSFTIGSGTSIAGSLQIQNLPKGGGQDEVCGSTVHGDVQVQNNGTEVIIGWPSTSCAGNTLGGNVQVHNNSAATFVEGNTISGNLDIQNNTPATVVSGNTTGAPKPPPPPPPPGPPPAKPSGDWSYYLGGANNASVSDGMYPAKFPFNINGAASCSDFVVFALNQNGAASTTANNGKIQMYQQNMNSPPADGSQVQIGAILYTFQTSLTSATTNNTCNVAIGAGSPSAATNLFGAVSAGAGTYSCDPAQANSAVTATQNNTEVDLTAKTAGVAGEVTVVAASNTNANFSALNNGPDGQASIIAFNNLYVAATQATGTGIFSGSAITAGKTVTINNTNTSTMLTLFAATPTAETATITFGATIPANNSNVKIGSVEYDFVNTTLTAPNGGKCSIHSLSPDTPTNVATYLFNAITNGGGGGTSTWLCAAGTTPNSAVTAMQNTTTIVLAAPVAGSNGFGQFQQNGTTNFTAFSSVAGFDGATIGPYFQVWQGASAITNAQTLATNLAAAINATGNGSSVGVTALANTPNNGTVTITAINFGTNGNNITLSTNASGLTVSGLSGGTTASGLCATGQVVSPTVLWAYNISNQPITTSPVLSPDGTKIAFVDKQGVVHLLRPNAGEGTASVPATVANTNSTSWSATACVNATSCMINVSLTNNSVTTSSPFYDYTVSPSVADNLYVGDDRGVVYKINGAFLGTPSFASGHGWSFTTSTNPLTGVVYDGNTHKIFVADTNNGDIYCVLDSAPDAAGGSASNCGIIATEKDSTNSGFKKVSDPPILDASIGMVYAFGGDWKTTTGFTPTPSSNNGCSTECAVVVQVAESSFSGSSSTPVTSAIVANIGTSGTAQHAGIFDNAYYTSAGGTGKLYVCDSANDTATLKSIAISGTMSASTTGTLALATDKEECSPLNEIDNTNQNSGAGIDWLFVGLPHNCATTGFTNPSGLSVANGCVMAIQIGTSSTESFPTAANATEAPENGGTSGIVVDNVDVTPAGQASSLYFTTLGNVNGACATNPAGDNTACAVKRTQSGLN